MVVAFVLGIVRSRAREVNWPHLPRTGRPGLGRDELVGVEAIVGVLCVARRHIVRVVSFRLDCENFCSNANLVVHFKLMETRAITVVSVDEVIHKLNLSRVAPEHFDWLREAFPRVVIAVTIMFKSPCGVVTKAKSVRANAFRAVRALEVAVARAHVIRTAVAMSAASIRALGRGGGGIRTQQRSNEDDALHSCAVVVVFFCFFCFSSVVVCVCLKGIGIWGGGRGCLQSVFACLVVLAVVGGGVVGGGVVL